MVKGPSAVQKKGGKPGQWLYLLLVIFGIIAGKVNLPLILYNYLAGVCMFLLHPHGNYTCLNYVHTTCIGLVSRATHLNQKERGVW